MWVHWIIITAEELAGCLHCSCRHCHLSCSSSSILHLLTVQLAALLLLLLMVVVVRLQQVLVTPQHR
jgi:hypothetical protein